MKKAEADEGCGAEAARIGRKEAVGRSKERRKEPARLITPRCLRIGVGFGNALSGVNVDVTGDFRRAVFGPGALVGNTGDGFLRLLQTQTVLARH